MNYEDMGLREALELSDSELETIVGGGLHGGWSEGDNDDDGSWLRRCRNGGQGFGGQDFGDQYFGGQGFGDQSYGSQGLGGQSYDGDDWQRRCRR